MNPQILQLLSMMAGNPGEGGDLVSQGLRGVMGTMIDPESGMGMAMGEMIENNVSPWIRDKMGLGPMDMFGGYNTVWDPTTAMNKMGRRQQQIQTGRQTRQQISSINDRIYQEQFGHAPGGILDPRRLALGAASLASGASNINNAFQQSLGVMGYTYGVPSAVQMSRNLNLQQNILGSSGVGAAVTEEFVRNQGAYGNIGGAGMSDLIKSMSVRGMMGGGDVGGAGGAGGTGFNAEAMQTNIRNTAKAISGIRDIIKGPVSEVIKQLEATFGMEAISAYGPGGLAAAATKMEQYRQMAMSTGLTTGQVAQYARASGMVSEQIAGHAGGTMGAGLTIAAFSTGTLTPGLDPNKFVNTMVQRVTGAQQSGVSLMVSAALVAAKEQGLSAEKADALRQKFLSAEGPMSAERIADIARQEGVKLTANDVQAGRYGRAARDMAGEDSTGTYVAMGQNLGEFMRMRGDALKSIGISEKDSGLSLRELREKYKGNQAITSALDGMTPTFDAYAKGFGYEKGDEEALTASNRKNQAIERERSAKIGGRLAQEFKMISGGLSGLLKDLGTGANIDTALRGLLGTMGKESQLEFIKKAATAEGGLLAGKGDFMTKFVAAGKDEQEKKARLAILQENLTKAVSGFDPATGKYMTEEEHKKFIAGISTGMEGEIEKKMKGDEYKLRKLAGDRDMSSLKLEDRQRVTAEFLAGKLTEAGEKGFGFDKKGWEKKSAEEKEKDLQKMLSLAKEKDEAMRAKEGGKGAGLLEEGTEKAITEGLQRGTGDYFTELMGVLNKLVNHFIGK